MSFELDFKQSLSSINDDNFENSSLALFNYQYDNCSVYQEFCNSLDKNPTNVSKVCEIPFLPIELFKSHEIKTGSWEPKKVFRSSGTTKTGRSQHFVKDPDFYLEVSRKIFEGIHGPIKDLEILALLPSYQEQGDSSLIAMIDSFMKVGQRNSGYFLNDHKALIEALRKQGTKKLLIGVSFALLDLVETGTVEFDGIIMETGGMKGRRKEITRDDLHNQLKRGFCADSIHSEYGMTELFSQAYAENGRFLFPIWAKVLIREVNDPFCFIGDHKTGGINIIDLANVDSCAFIETKDLGRSNGRVFEVLGRFDNSDVRGCNLMIQRKP